MKNIEKGGKPSRPKLRSLKRPRSPTRHGSELDRAVRQILRENIPEDEKARRVFLLLSNYTTPDDLGGMNAFQVAVTTVRRKLNGGMSRLLDPEEVPSLLYLAIHNAVRNWDPSGGLSFLAYVINGAIILARPRPEERHAITFTDLRRTRGRWEEEVDEDRLGVLGAWEEWA